jgi:hypothetical protein
VIVAGLKRLALVTCSLGSATVAVSLVIGLVTGTALSRAASLGLMFLGAFMFVAGAAVGLRGPVRVTRRPDGTFEKVTLASPAERVETINVSHLLVGVGLFFVLIGVILDPYAHLA